MSILYHGVRFLYSGVWRSRRSHGVAMSLVSGGFPLPRWSALRELSRLLSPRDRYFDTRRSPGFKSDPDLHWPSKRHKPTDEAIVRDRVQSSLAESGDSRLMCTQAVSSLRLGPAFLPDDVGDQRREARFHQVLLRVGQAEVREDVSAALQAAPCFNWYRPEVTGRADFPGCLGLLP